MEEREVSSFASRLVELRSDTGLPQDVVARALGVSRSTLAGWESGAREPNIDKLKAIANYYHCTLDYLLGGDDVLEDNIPSEQRILLQTLSGATEDEIRQTRTIIDALRRAKARGEW